MAPYEECPTSLSCYAWDAWQFIDWQGIVIAVCFWIASMGISYFTGGRGEAKQIFLGAFKGTLVTLAAIGLFLLGLVFYSPWQRYKTLKEFTIKSVGEKDKVIAAHTKTIQDLEAKLKEPPKVVYREKPAMATAPPTINSLFAEARAVCSLQDPSKLPNMIGSRFPTDMSSFFDGPPGKAYLRTIDQVIFQRAEEEGKASTILRYDLPSNSSLSGQPVSMLSKYGYLRINLWALDYSRFTRCGSIELTLRINGMDSYRKAKTDLPPLPAPKSNYKFEVQIDEIRLPR